MDILIETTIQYDRLFASNQCKQAIRKVLETHSLKTTTYVMGEYYSRYLKDFLKICHILNQENDIYNAEKRLFEGAFGSQEKDRRHKLFIFIRETCSNDIDLIKENYKRILELIIHRPLYGIEGELLDETGCNKAKCRIEYENDIPKLINNRCRKDDNICRILEFWEKHINGVNNLSTSSDIEKKTKDALLVVLDNIENCRGNNCRDLGDLIIALETLALEDGAVCSTNKNHFRPICEAINAKLLLPDYSFKS